MFEQIALGKFRLRWEWLKRNQATMSVSSQPGFIDEARLDFCDEVLGRDTRDGTVELSLLGRGDYEAIATIRRINTDELWEGVALLALDLAELHNIGISQPISRNRLFHQQVLVLAAELRNDLILSRDSWQLKSLLLQVNAPPDSRLMVPLVIRSARVPVASPEWLQSYMSAGRTLPLLTP